MHVGQPRAIELHDHLERVMVAAPAERPHTAAQPQTSPALPGVSPIS
jgi:hypothetical protein